MSSTIVSRKHLVRWWLNVTLAIAFSPLLPLHAEESFPYTAIVHSSEAAIHGGPSEDFYTTDSVQRGEEVEVYRHEPDGWCAIRPLVTSFSWVAAEHLEITDNPVLARVINVPVKTRVGSNFSDAHDVEYISLRKGEIVELVGSQMLVESGAEAPVRWFKIAPPSGEFRWMHSRHLKRSRPSTGRSSESEMEPTDIKTYRLQATEVAAPATLDSNALADAKLLSEVPADASSRSNDTGFSEPDAVQQVSYETSAADSPASAGTRSKPAAPTLAATNASQTPDQTTTHVNTITWEAVSSPTDPLASPEPRSFVDQYNALNVMLSRAILDDIETWKLDKLRSQTAMLVEAAEMTEEQQLAQALADKVAEFQSLQQRSSDLAAQGEILPVAGALPAGRPLPLPEFKSDASLPHPKTTNNSGHEMPQRVVVQPRVAVDASALKKEEALDNSVFDASGTLVAVKSRRPGVPKYAITNSNGEVVKFLSTKDGSNLSQFVNKEVGVMGQLGFIRSLNKSHVVANRVVLLQR